jgi:hypothetical protein
MIVPAGIAPPTLRSGFVPKSAVLPPLEASAAYWTAAPANCWPVATLTGVPVPMSVAAVWSRPAT